MHLQTNPVDVNQKVKDLCISNYVAYSWDLNTWKLSIDKSWKLKDQYGSLSEPKLK